MPIQYLRRHMCIVSALFVVNVPAIAASSSPTVEVWKSPTCGCCKEWVKHLEHHGFTVKTHDVGNNGIRQRLGMPAQYAACHTATVGNYVIEGHVPGADISRLLKEKPTALGIAVPRMPIGSPGMDGPAYGGRIDPYNVLLIQKDGSATVFQAHGQ